MMITDVFGKLENIRDAIGSQTANHKISNYVMSSVRIEALLKGMNAQFSYHLLSGNSIFSLTFERNIGV